MTTTTRLAQGAMMDAKKRQEVLSEMQATRASLEGVLASLVEARAQSEKRLHDLKRSDTLKTVTGKSSLDTAIASTQRMVETIDRSIDQIRKDFGG